MKDLIRDKPANRNILKGCSANTLEWLLMAVVPVFPVSDSKIQFGSQQKPSVLLQEELYVQVGGGVILIKEYWRDVSVGEIIKMNKILTQFKPKKGAATMTKAFVDHLTNKLSLDKRIVEEFKGLASSSEEQPGLSQLWTEAQNVLAIWKKRQNAEASKRGKPVSKKKSKD